MSQYEKGFPHVPVLVPQDWNTYDPYLNGSYVVPVEDLVHVSVIEPMDGRVFTGTAGLSLRTSYRCEPSLATLRLSNFSSLSSLPNIRPLFSLLFPAMPVALKALQVNVGLTTQDLEGDEEETIFFTGCIVHLVFTNNSILRGVSSQTIEAQLTLNFPLEETEGAVTVAPPFSYDTSLGFEEMAVTLPNLQPPPILL